MSWNALGLGYHARLAARHAPAVFAAFMPGILALIATDAPTCVNTGRAEILNTPVL
jgi:hypothetical protein